VLDTGEVDFAWNLQLDVKTLAQFEQAGQGRVITVLGPGVERIVLNLSDPNKETSDGERSFREFPNPILSDKKVRQALAYAIDREAIAELSLGARPTSNLLVAPSVYNSPNTTYEFNLEKAKALLDEAGWTEDADEDGFREKEGVEMSLIFQTSANAARQQTQELVRQTLADVGIRVEPRVIDAGIFFGGNQSNPQTLERFYADLEEYFALNQNPDPGSYMKNWTSEQIPQKANNWQGQNVARWDNPQYDALYRQSTAELDPEKRQQLFIQMNDLIVNEVVMIPLFNRAQVSGVSQTLEGVDINPWDAELWNIKDWRRKP
jgi:peptide/nickel transport system substrate-binding protein